MKLKPWRRGRLLDTTITRQMPPNERLACEYFESLRIFTSFMERDKGCSRKLVCTLDESHPDFKLNRCIIENAPEILNLLKAVVNLSVNDSLLLIADEATDLFQRLREAGFEMKNRS